MLKPFILASCALLAGCAAAHKPTTFAGFMMAIGNDEPLFCNGTGTPLLKDGWSYRCNRVLDNDSVVEQTTHIPSQGRMVKHLIGDGSTVPVDVLVPGSADTLYSITGTLEEKEYMGHAMGEAFVADSDCRTVDGAMMVENKSETALAKCRMAIMAFMRNLPETDFIWREDRAHLPHGLGIPELRI